MTLLFTSPEAQARLDEILEFIGSQPLPTSKDVVALIGMSTSHTYVYLRHLEEIGKIHRIPAKVGLTQWAVGASAPIKARKRTGPRPKTQAELDAEIDRRMGVKRKFMPAQQVGMVRDALIAALFGPAGAQVSV